VNRERTGPTSRAEFVNLFGNVSRVQILAFLWKCDRSTTAGIARGIRKDSDTVESQCQRLQGARLLQQREGEETEFWQLTTKGDTAAGKIARPMLDVALGR